MPNEIIQAKPTKKLFIDTLTQDISVKACILDLIDNSIDSYIRYKLSDRRLIQLKLSKDSFYLLDECGGIDKEYLKSHVFRFGNYETQFNDPTLGMYGIGLKRSIFKLGKSITIITDDGKNYCKVELKVEEWKKNDDDWDIPLETEVSKLKGKQHPYTEIYITNLNDEVSEKFGLVAFENELSETIKKVYCLMLKDQIEFKLGNQTIGSYPLLVPASNDNAEIAIDKTDDINIEIICFIDPTKGTRLANAVNQRGWNVFCNRRLILSNDTSEITGWRGGDEVKNKSMLPKYHSIYNEFRGIVFLNSNNPFKLPLNTAKTNFNTEDKNYNYILNKMVLTARPVIDFLTAKYADEKQKGDDIENEIDTKENQEANQEMKELTERELKPSSFKAAQRGPSPKLKDSVRISYTKSKKLVDKIASHFSITTPKEVGEYTFDYFIKMEEFDNE
jgi:hypothetical protein